MDKILIGISSGRAKCQSRSCPNPPIAKGEVEVVAKLGSGYFEHHYHLSCFKTDNWGFIRALYNSMSPAEREDLDRK